MRERWELWGWLLFLLCAVLFIVAAVRDGDALMVVASVAFAIGCVVFVAAGRRP